LPGEEVLGDVELAAVDPGRSEADFPKLGVEDVVPVGGAVHEHVVDLVDGVGEGDVLADGDRVEALHRRRGEVVVVVAEGPDPGHAVAPPLGDVGGVGDHPERFQTGGGPLPVDEFEEPGAGVRGSHRDRL
jgi:hypothetical protein